MDNQLRGRAGRQGDKGSSHFYLSLEDNLMRIFASERVAGLMQRLGMNEGEAIEHPWVSKAIENAQRKVEGHNFDMRKQLLEYDDVANDQRKVIYEQRNDLMKLTDISESIESIRHDVVNNIIDTYVPPQSIEEQWDLQGLEETLEGEFGAQCKVREWLEQDQELNEYSLREKIVDEIVNEPLGGAHMDRENTFVAVRDCIVKTHDELKNLSPKELVKQRMEKYSQMGVFKD